jgi:RNA polymerase sigma factor (sigma-70 family)
VEELRRHVLAVASRFLRRPEDAEDITQEALLRLASARAKVSAIGDERAYARRTAIHLAIDRLRSERLRSRKLAELKRANPGPTDGGLLPVDVRRLYDAIAALPAKQAAVVTLRKLMELEYSDIAALLGISVENCRSHCRHGLDRLRRELGDEQAPDKGGS